MHFSDGVKIAWALFLAASPVFPNSALLDLPADSWYAAPNTPMHAVCPPREKNPGIQGSGGCAMVVDAWSGGAYDDVRHRMYVWGGGHNDYYGNEMYSFDVETLAWSLLTQPSQPPNTEQDPLPDGQPVSRHTYDGLVFLRESDQLLAYGGSMAGLTGNATAVTWLFDLSDRTWIQAKPTGTPPDRHVNSAYDPATGRALVRDHSAVFAYDPQSNGWTTLKAIEHQWGVQRGAFDTVRRIFFAIGGTELQAFQVDQARDVASQWPTQGAEGLVAADAPGLDYDRDADCLVGWTGGAPYVLDLATKTWSRGSSRGAPDAPSSAGVYGRWRYLPEYNVFLLVNGVDQNVYFYKHTAGGPRPSATRNRSRIRRAMEAPGHPVGNRFDALARSLPSGARRVPAPEFHRNSIGSHGGGANGGRQPGPSAPFPAAPAR